MSVLVVDDEADLVELIEAELRDAGYTVKAAADGLQALEVFKSFNPAIVVTDLMMPRLDGYGLIEQLQKQSHQAKVIVLSAYGDRDGRLASLGVSEVLVKPAKLAAIVAAVRRVSAR